MHRCKVPNFTSYSLNLFSSLRYSGSFSTLLIPDRKARLKILILQAISGLYPILINSSYILSPLTNYLHLPLGSPRTLIIGQSVLPPPEYGTLQPNPLLFGNTYDFPYISGPSIYGQKQSLIFTSYLLIS